MRPLPPHSSPLLLRHGAGDQQELQPEHRIVVAPHVLLELAALSLGAGDEAVAEEADHRPRPLHLAHCKPTLISRVLSVVAADLNETSRATGRQIEKGKYYLVWSGNVVFKLFIIISQLDLISLYFKHCKFF